MNGLLEKTARRLEPLRGKTLALGVSGGRDSLCLLHAALNCGAVEKSQLLAVHVNHGLRDQADSDELFVREFCLRNGVEFRAYRVNVKAESAKNGLTIEQAARNLRYAVFYDLIGNGEADVVLTAHHALDNAETVLMHLFRGAGLDGMRGMADGGTLPVVRPFLDVYPCELDEYCAQNGLKFVVDDTNFLDDADRNYIRLNVIPIIERRYKGAVRAINALSAECARACDYMESSIDPSLITYSDGAVLIADDALIGGLAARYVRRALAYFSTVDITREQTDRVVALAHMRIGASVELSGGIVAAREYGRVALYIPRLECDAEYPVALGGNYIDGLAVDIARCDVSPQSVKGGAVDFDKLDGAVLRFRRDGDVFTPFGGKRKKLKQYFIDKKIPKRLRNRIPLICRGDEVLVAVGVEISDSVKQTADTAVKAVVRLRR